MMKMDYDNSVELALALNFKRVEDPEAFNGEYFIKGNKKWIHWIQKLKAKLGIEDEEELREHGYVLDSYYKYRGYTNAMARECISMQIKESIYSQDSVLSCKVDILNNKQLLQSMISLKEEGFDDEILASFHHEMSKR